MNMIYIVIFFIFGTIVGSFLNALIYRFWKGKDIVFDRSMCPDCNHTLSPGDLIPVVSFLFLWGRCRYCHEKISWQYPVVEIICGIAFVLVGLKFGFVLSELLFFELAAVGILLLIAVFDLKHYLILDKVVFPATILALAQAIYVSFSSGGFGLDSGLVNGLLGAAMVSGFFGLQYYISKGKWIGFGDVKLGLFLGLLFGVGQGLVLLFLSYCVGAGVGLILVALGYKKLGSKLPFGTFLGFCAIIMLIYGESILSWYLKIIGF